MSDPTPEEVPDVVPVGAGPVTPPPMPRPDPGIDPDGA